MSDEGCVNTILARHGSRELRLWWRFSDNIPLLPPVSSNHALTALLPLAMHEAADLHVRGTVDRTLVENLEEVIDAWTLWRPDLYRRIHISADSIIEGPPRPGNDAALMYSGGVDANYALLAHKSGLLGHRNRNIGAAVLVHGFDIPLTNVEWFDTARQHALPILDNVGCQLLEVRTNWREVSVDWEMDHGFAITSVLHQLDATYSHGLWAADEPYNREVIPWGSNSISNPLLSGGVFPIRTVGAGANRSTKVGLIAQNDVVRNHLRVCWRHPDNGLNCGICEKCVRTRLALLAHGFEHTQSFHGTLTPELVLGIKIGNRIQLELLEEILSIPNCQLPPKLRSALSTRIETHNASTQQNRRSWKRWFLRGL